MIEGSVPDGYSFAGSCDWRLEIIVSERDVISFSGRKAAEFPRELVYNPGHHKPLEFHFTSGSRS
jgi:hypothetical protein